MAQLPAIFNPNAPGQERVGDFSAIDPGDYPAHISDSKMKMTKENIPAKQYLEIIWQILAGPCEGRKIWTRLNLVNPSSQAVEIANKHLTSICDAVGVPGPVSDSSVLHGIPCMISVIKKPADAQYPEGNEVRNYAPMPPGGVPMPQTAAPGAPAGAAGAMAAATAAPAAAVMPPTAPTGAPPWAQPAAPAPLAPPAAPVAEMPPAAAPPAAVAEPAPAPAAVLAQPIVPDPAAEAAPAAVAAAPAAVEPAPAATEVAPEAKKPPWIK